MRRERSITCPDIDIEINDEEVLRTTLGYRLVCAVGIRADPQAAAKRQLCGSTLMLVGFPLYLMLKNSCISFGFHSLAVIPAYRVA